MKTKDNYFPETAVFWGAGATCDIGFPVTAQQGKLIISLSKCENVESYKDKLSSFGFFDCDALNEFSKLLFILDNTNSEKKIANNFNNRNYSSEQFDVARELFKNVFEEDLTVLLMNLRKDYDLRALKEIIKMCPQDSSTVVMDTFNLIDYHYLNNEGFYGNDGFVLNGNRLIAARNSLIMIIQTVLTASYQKSLKDNQEVHNRYRKFAKDLVSYAHKDTKNKVDIDFKERDFFLLPFYFISLNWDHYLLWQIFQANKDFNNKSSIFGKVNKKLKFFNDLAIRMGLRELKETQSSDLDNKIWYPYNETVVQRVNDSDYGNNRIVRIGKYFFPHGSLALRACPSCGGLVGSLGDTWDSNSDSLFPPTLIPSLRRIINRTDKEKIYVQNGYYDAMECIHCGAITSVKDSLMVMQTIMKGTYPPSLKMIQSEINSYLMHSNHIVFMGYSLPKDDLIWKSILLARKARRKNPKISILVGYQGDKVWQYAQKLEDLNDRDKEQYKTFFDIFGGCEMRFFTGGIPAIFDVYSVEEILDYKC